MKEKIANFITKAHRIDIAYKYTNNPREARIYKVYGDKYLISDWDNSYDGEYDFEYVVDWILTTVDCARMLIDENGNTLHFEEDVKNDSN